MDKIKVPKGNKIQAGERLFLTGPVVLTFKLDGNLGASPNMPSAFNAPRYISESDILVEVLSTDSAQDVMAKLLSSAPSNGDLQGSSFGDYVIKQFGNKIVVDPKLWTGVAEEPYAVSLRADGSEGAFKINQPAKLNEDDE